MSQVRTSFVVDSKSAGVMKPAIAVAVFLAALVTLIWMWLLPSLVTSEMNYRSGFDVQFEQMACNPFGMNLAVRNVRVANPAHFESSEDMLVITSLDLEMAVGEWTSSEKVIRAVDLNIDQVTLVIDEQGRLNLAQFVGLLDAELVEFSKVKLSVETLIVVNYQPTVPVVRRYELGLKLDGFATRGVSGLFAPIVEVSRKAGYIPSGTQYGASAIVR